MSLGGEAGYGGAALAGLLTKEKSLPRMHSGQCEKKKTLHRGIKAKLSQGKVKNSNSQKEKETC